MMVVGGLNWLLFAFGADLAQWVGAPWWQTVLKVVYVLVGLSAVFELITHRNNCKGCDKVSNQPVS